MSYRQQGGYERDYDRRGGGRDYRAAPPRERQQLNYDDLDGDSSGLPPPRYQRGGYDDDRNGYRGGHDRRGDHYSSRAGGERGGYERRRSRSPPPPRRDDDYSRRDRDRGQLSALIPLQVETDKVLLSTDSRPSRRSPSPRRRTRSPSRSRSPPSTSRRRSPSPARRRDRERSSPPPPRREDGRDRERSKSLVTADDAADVDEQDIAAMMGFGGFGTTQGKAHEGELSGAAVKRERAHRQYMNRKGGFNRPLDKIK
ncbi:hypothetical protein JCM5350_004825 [Sporobolomyces pararoseus]